MYNELAKLKKTQSNIKLEDSWDNVLFLNIIFG